MQIWLLGCTLPTVFTRPVPAQPNSPSINGIVLMDPRTFINRMVRRQFDMFKVSFIYRPALTSCRLRPTALPIGRHCTTATMTACH